MRESPGSCGGLCRHLHPGLSRPGELVDPVGLQTRAPVGQESWSTPLALNASASGPGQLVDHKGPLIHARVTWDSWSTPLALYTSASGPGELLHNKGPRILAESAGRAGRHRGHSDPDPSRLEELVDPAGPWTQVRVTGDSWSTLQALADGPESHGASG